MKSQLRISVLLVIFEKAYPMTGQLSNQPILELIFAITLPSIASALLFQIGASSGGTDVIAMIVQKYTSVKNIGIALFISDLVMIIAACFVFDIQTALYSFVGLTVKSFLIDGIIDSINLSKAVTIVSEDHDIICRFITNDLQKGATITEALGAYTNTKKYVIFTTLSRRQAVLLRNYIRDNSLDAFISVSSTSEVFGKGFSSI